MKARSIVVSIFFLCLSSLAHSQHQLGVSVSAASVDGDDLDASFTNAGIAYEYYLPGSNFSFEIEALSGGSDTVSGVDFDVNYYVTSKLNFGIPSGDNFFYASIGGGFIEVEGSRCYFGCYSVTEDGSGVVAGVGANFQVSQSVRIDLSVDVGFGDLEDTTAVTGSLRWQF